VEAELSELTSAAVAGFAAGFMVAIPVGPLGLTVVNTALRRGFGVAFLAGLGGVCGEAVYAALMLAGHSSLLSQPRVAYVLQLLSVAVLLGLGVKYLFSQPARLAASEAVAVRTDERWHHPSAFLLGFFLTVSNLALLVLWATLTALLFGHGWVQPDHISRLVCFGGVMLGGSAWFALLAFSVSRAHRRVSPRALTLLVRACGAVFLVFALLFTVRFACG
jgi:threonine/homoserine/homoserine lactone efflux protein